MAVRIGMVGSGFVAGLHGAAYRDVPGVELRRIAGRNPETTAALAARDGWQAAGTDWHAVTRADDVDVVAVCTPDDAHRAIAEDALAHGKHVFCEKPLAPTDADARAMTDAAARAGRVASTGFVLRFWPALEHARELLAGGELGALRAVRARYLLDSETLLESSLRGLGSHALDAVVVLAGPVAAAAALVRPTAASAAVDGRAAVLLELAGGATGVLEVDREARGRAMDLVIEADCEAGAVELAWRTRDTVTVRTAGGAARTVELGPAPVAGLGFSLRDLFVLQAQRLAAVAGGDAAPYPAFADGLHVAEVTEAILAAHERRTWIVIG